MRSLLPSRHRRVWRGGRGNRQRLLHQQLPPRRGEEGQPVRQDRFRSAVPAAGQRGGSFATASTRISSITSRRWKTCGITAISTCRTTGPIRRSMSATSAVLPASSSAPARALPARKCGNHDAPAFPLPAGCAVISAARTRGVQRRQAGRSEAPREAPGQWADRLIPAVEPLPLSPTGRRDRPRSRLATKEPFPDSGAQRLIRATTAYAAFRSPGERSDAGSVPFTNAQHLRFRKAISVRARRQTRESPGAYIQYVTG